MLDTALSAIKEKGIRYVIAGGFNTLFGYIVGLLLYYSLERRLHIVTICIISNIICITMSFATYKFFVFKTKGNFFAEYLRCYIVYGGSALVSILGLWVLVDLLHIYFWFASLAMMGLSVFISFFGHDLFTFRISKKHALAEATRKSR